ncbi:hypothetical protein PRIPAC_79935, partial [Pristionchus pacificus]
QFFNSNNCNNVLNYARQSIGNRIGKLFLHYNSSSRFCVSTRPGKVTIYQLLEGMTAQYLDVNAYHLSTYDASHILETISTYKVEHLCLMVGKPELGNPEMFLRTLSSLLLSLKIVQRRENSYAIFSYLTRSAAERLQSELPQLKKKISLTTTFNVGGFGFEYMSNGCVVKYEAHRHRLHIAHSSKLHATMVFQ